MLIQSFNWDVCQEVSTFYFVQFHFHHFLKLQYDLIKLSITLIEFRRIITDGYEIILKWTFFIPSAINLNEFLWSILQWALADTQGPYCINKKCTKCYSNIKNYSVKNFKICLQLVQVFLHEILSPKLPVILCDKIQNNNVTKYKLSKSIPENIKYQI